MAILAIEGVAMAGLAGAILNAFGLWQIVGTSPMTVWSLSFALGLLGVNARFRSVLSWMTAALLVVLLVVAYTPIMRPVSARWVLNEPVHPPLDAIVVLSGSVKSNGALNTDGLERLLTGVQLLKQMPGAVLITSRVGTDFGEGRVTSDQEQQRIIALSGFSGEWRIVDSVTSTRDEAVRSAELLIPRNKRKIAVITTPMHTRRACRAFEAVGFDATCVATLEHENVTLRPRTPGDRIAAFRDYLYELLGMVKYRWNGWFERRP
ncbi:MAG TPA: YdcF family protein [Gemmatimonadaceae bacterium]